MNTYWMVLVAPFDVVSLVGALAAVDVSTVVFTVVSAIVVRGVDGDVDVGILTSLTKLSIS